MDIKGSFRKASFRYGSYSTVMTVVVLAILIVANLLVRQLPADLIYWDLSEQKLFSVGDKSKSFIAGMDEDVTIYLIAETGTEDMTIYQLLETYDSLSDHIKIEMLDPNKDFATLTKYDIDTTESISSNSVLVTSEKRSKFIAYSEIYELDYEYYVQYQQELYDFDGEGEITSALSYVTSEALPKMYLMTGHSELALGETITSMIEKANIEIAELNLLSSEIPEDCDVLLMSTPGTDYSAEEAEKIKDYMDAGGNAILLTYFGMENFPNYDSVLKYYGVERQMGLVYESGNLALDKRAPYYAIVTANGEHEIMDSYSESDLVISVQAQGLAQTADARSTLTFSPLLTTSTGSYLRVDLEKAGTASKIEDDLDGPFHIAVAVEDKNGNVSSKMVVFATPYFVDESILTNYASVANSGIFMSSLGWMCSFEQSISIPAKSMNYPTNLYTDEQMNTALMITALIIPVAILVTGLVVWYKRRTR